MNMIPREAVTKARSMTSVRTGFGLQDTREMPLNERREIVKAWPGGFFEEGLKEVL
ncbi:hypothetical protein QUF72_12285 [Desulfobacterales bacterium HSG2]|nr:hypothetical protein [Desulfobacterales bacterium HSG2]